MHTKWVLFTYLIIKVAYLYYNCWCNTATFHCLIAFAYKINKKYVGTSQWLVNSWKKRTKKASELFFIQRACNIVLCIFKIDYNASRIAVVVFCWWQWLWVFNVYVRLVSYFKPDIQFRTRAKLYKIAQMHS